MRELLAWLIARICRRQDEVPADQPHGDRRRNPTGQQGHVGDPVAGAIVDSRERIIEELRAHYNQAQRNEDRNYRLAYRAALIAALYAGVSALQFGGMLYL